MKNTTKCWWTYTFSFTKCWFAYILGSKMFMEHIMQECFRFYMKERLMKIFQGLRVEIKNTKLILTIYIFMIGGNWLKFWKKVHNKTISYGTILAHSFCCSYNKIYFIYAHFPTLFSHPLACLPVLNSLISFISIIKNIVQRLIKTIEIL